MGQGFDLTDEPGALVEPVSDRDVILPNGPEMQDTPLHRCGMWATGRVRSWYFDP